ncbi:MAG: ribonuclease J [Clostridia bacterium]|nr:ribonuclease J [Oscillospiraceae bacterium]MBR6748266.1 ribonuclease J [Clostridia bacterium]
MAEKLDKLKIIPLGGLGEIGKNITVLEYENDILVVDCGIGFPDEDMLGVDLVIPDISYLEKNKDKVRGIVITHGHEDHLGAIPYFLRQINVPVYGTTMTLGILGTKLAEHGLLTTTEMITVAAGDYFELGCFGIEPIRTNHSIPDSCALAISTPLGNVIITGDFKIDATPVAGEMIDLTRFGELGEEGVLLLISDSTNVERPGFSMSERSVGEALEAQFKGCDQRIIIGSFASNVHRIQQIMDIAAKYGRKVAVSGRSMENIVQVASTLGYLDIPDKVLIELSALGRYPKNKVCVITTGSQGEAMSALYRIAFAGHKQIEIGPEDKVVLAASTIPGNEKSVYRMVNELIHRGADVVYEKMAGVHASGHGNQEELKIMLSLTKPRYFMPGHGEYRHLKAHAELAKSMGMDPNDIFIGENGRTLEITKKGAKLSQVVPAGKVFVDGLGVGDVGNVVLRDRKHLSQDGLVVLVLTLSSDDGTLIAGPDIISRGFIYVRESDDLMDELKIVVLDIIDRCQSDRVTDWATIKSMIKSELSNYLYQKTKRNPMILPVITEI